MMIASHTDHNYYNCVD